MLSPKLSVFSLEFGSKIVICNYSLPARSQPPSCINKRLLCPSLASTLRNPILPKVVSKRKYVGLDEPNFDEDVEKNRPNAGQEYDPDGDYIYDARKYFNPEKYREIIAHQEEKKKKQQQPEKKFYYKAFCRRRRHYPNMPNTDSGHLYVNYVDVIRDGLSLSPSSLQHTEYCVYDGKLQSDDGHSSKRHKKAKKKPKHSKHHSHSHTLNSCHKHSKRKKGDMKHKKKQKQKKHSDTPSTSFPDNHNDYRTSSKKHHAKLRHRSRHRSRLFSSQEPSSRVTNVTSCDFSYGTRNLGEHLVGKTRDNSDLCYLSDDNVSASYCRRSPCEDSGPVSDCAENFSHGEDESSNYEERQVTQHAAAGAWQEDSSVSSPYSDVNRDFSRTDDERNCDDID